uniref:Uncharacterized protein n=1 Tax=Ditylenchus dipsaci TaxID=166011 RepID=A0A915D2D5_9BILA
MDFLISFFSRLQNRSLQGTTLSSRLLEECQTREIANCFRKAGFIECMQPAEHIHVEQLSVEGDDELNQLLAKLQRLNLVDGTFDE